MCRLWEEGTLGCEPRLNWAESLLFGYFIIMGIVTVFSSIMAWRQRKEWAREGLKLVTVLMEDEE